MSQVYRHSRRRACRGTGRVLCHCLLRFAGVFFSSVQRDLRCGEPRGISLRSDRLVAAHRQDAQRENIRGRRKTGLTRGRRGPMENRGKEHSLGAPANVVGIPGPPHHGWRQTDNLTEQRTNVGLGRREPPRPPCHMRSSTSLRTRSCCAF